MTADSAPSDSKTVYAMFGIWYNETQRMIHIPVPKSSWFHSAMSNDPTTRVCTQRGDGCLKTRVGGRGMSEWVLVSNQKPCSVGFCRTQQA